MNTHVKAIRHAATCGMDALLRMALAKAKELDRLASNAAPRAEVESPRWIPVGERKPKDDDFNSFVAVVYDGIFDNEHMGTVYASSVARGTERTRMTHWTELPRGPRSP